jgi:hypothetical protein
MTFRHTIAPGGRSKIDERVVPAIAEQLHTLAQIASPLGGPTVLNPAVQVPQRAGPHLRSCTGQVVGVGFPSGVGPNSRSPGRGASFTRNRAATTTNVVRKVG